uniref:Integrase n=1 Tax=Parastrongyloides trichosuri TaxID=131310 RepID=A0A0N5A6X9_PARTI
MRSTTPSVRLPIQSSLQETPRNRDALFNDLGIEKAVFDRCVTVGNESGITRYRRVSRRQLDQIRAREGQGEPRLAAFPLKCDRGDWWNKVVHDRGGLGDQALGGGGHPTAYDQVRGQVRVVHVYAKARKGEAKRCEPRDL